MAVLYITEFADITSFMQGGKLFQMPQQPPVVEQAIATSGSSASSAAFNSKTRYVRLHNDSSSAVCFLFGTGTVTAVAGTNARLSAGTTEYHAVPVGQSYKVAAVTVAT